MADLARAIIGPDHPANAIAIGAARIGIIGRVVAPVEEVPAMHEVTAVEERPVMDIAMDAVAAKALIAAATIDVRRAEAAAMIGAETSAAVIAATT